MSVCDVKMLPDAQLLIAVYRWNKKQLDVLAIKSDQHTMNSTAERP